MLFVQKIRFVGCVVAAISESRLAERGRDTPATFVGCAVAAISESRLAERGRDTPATFVGCAVAAISESRLTERGRDTPATFVGCAVAAISESRLTERGRNTPATFIGCFAIFLFVLPETSLSPEVDSRSRGIGLLVPETSRYSRKGLVCFSAPMVVAGPWPGRTWVLSGRVSSCSRMERSSRL